MSARIEKTELNEKGFSDTFERNDCGGYDYPNGFTFPLEETGSISDACQAWHGGQWSDCYSFASSGHAAPSTIAGIEAELSRCEDSGEADDDLMTALEDVRAWLAGVEDCLPD